MLTDARQGAILPACQKVRICTSRRTRYVSNAHHHCPLRLCFLTLLVGVYAGRRVKDSADFVVAGRRLGILLATGTLSATWFGTGTVLGAAGAAYKGGFLAIIADPFGAALCLFLAGLFYVRMMRRMGVSTIAEFFERRFGKTAGVVAAACTIPAYIGWVASLMVGFGKIIHALTGLDAVLGTCLGAAIVLIYTTIGGMWAVTRLTLFKCLS